MRTRVLPVEEWPRLKHTDAETVWPMLDPDRTLIVVVEDDGLIVAHHILSFVLHAECLWVHPDYRKGLAGGRLWQAVKRAVLAGMRTRGFWTAAETDEVKALIAKVGGTRINDSRGNALPHYLMTVEG